MGGPREVEVEGIPAERKPAISAIRDTADAAEKDVLGRAQVVELEDELLRQELLVPPDDPADTDVRHSVCGTEPLGQPEKCMEVEMRARTLVTRGVDRVNSRDLEVPLEVRVGEGRDEPSGPAL